jgi:hypothetical protein
MTLIFNEDTGEVKEHGGEILDGPWLWYDTKSCFSCFDENQKYIGYVIEADIPTEDAATTLVFVEGAAQ